MGGMNISVELRKKSMKFPKAHVLFLGFNPTWSNIQYV